MWRNIKKVDELLQGMLSLSLQCYLSTGTSLCLRHVPSFAIFPSVTRRRRWRQRHRKHNFHSILLFPMIFNAKIWLGGSAKPQMERVGSPKLNQLLWTKLYSSFLSGGSLATNGSQGPLSRKVRELFEPEKASWQTVNPLVLKSWSFNVILM